MGRKQGVSIKYGFELLDEGHLELINFKDEVEARRVVVALNKFEVSNGLGLFARKVEGTVYVVGRLPKDGGVGFEARQMNQALRSCAGSVGVMSAAGYVAKYIAKGDAKGGLAGVDVSWWRSHSEPYAAGIWTMAVWGENIQVITATGVVDDFGNLVSVTGWKG